MSDICLPEEPSGKPQDNASVDHPVICLLNKQKRYGTLKFVGETEFSSGVWCGIELNEPCGKNDGAVAGKRYFQCENHHGIFVNPKNVFPINSEPGTECHFTTKQIKRRVLPNVIQETPTGLGENVTTEYENHEEISRDNKYQLYSDNKDIGRPRSKSDHVLTNERKDQANIFSDSPFKCDIKGAKCASLPKLNNATYICHSLANESAGENQIFSHPKHSSPLSSLQSGVTKTDTEDSRKSSQHFDSGATSSAKPAMPSPVHHVQLSPQLEVKQSIKLDSINPSRFSSSVNRPESGLNKTFLISKQTPRLDGRTEELEPQEKPTSIVAKIVNDSHGKTTIIKDTEKQEKLDMKLDLSSKNEKLDTNDSNCNATDVRFRSLSKSSWSSVESISSAGSTKGGKERNRLKSTEVKKESSRKLPRTSDSSRSKLKKISAESKIKSKGTEKEEPKRSQKTSVSKSSTNKTGGNDSALKMKSRTKSSSTVSGGFTSVFDTPCIKNSVKPKSKSVSVEGESAVKSQVSTSKLSTPFASKVPGTTGIAPRRLTCTPHPTSMTEKQRKVKANDDSVNAKAGVSAVASAGTSAVANNRAKFQRSLSQESNKSESKNVTGQVKDKVPKTEKCKTKQENKTSVTRTRIASTPRVDTSSSKISGVKSSSLKSSVSRASRPPSGSAVGLREPRNVSEKSGSERSFLKKKIPSEDSIKRALVNEKVEKTGGILPNLALTPDILKQTPEVTRHSVAVQVDTESLRQELLVHSLKERYNDERKRVQSLAERLTRRNREFEATLIALQLYSQKVGLEIEKVTYLRNYVDSTEEKLLDAEKKIAKETSRRTRLEDEILTIKSDSVVDQALLKAEYERKQELIRAKLVDDHRENLEDERKRNTKAMDELKRSCDLKMERVEETYVHDIIQIKEKHRDEIAELETQHSKTIEELEEERQAEIETIKADYEEQMEQLQERLSESEGKCSKLSEKLRIVEEESKRDIELRIQDAIAKYKTLPDELESMQFVLEMKNNEIKKLRQNTAELQSQIDELRDVKNRAALLEREKESLNFVVENKVQFERKLSLERDKLRLSLDREVATSKRLSLENEELAWRLNSFQNSPTSPTFERISWRGSGFNSPDSAIFSQRIEESDFESQMTDTKEVSS